MKHRIRCILTDIEGTTSSVSFVYDILFPYFRSHIYEAEQLEQGLLDPIFEATRKQAALENKKIDSKEECLNILLAWSMDDKKYTPLKTLQGLIWEKGYKNGDLKSHFYADVPENLKKWHNNNTVLAVYSSGSVQAQKLLFKYSEYGDLSTYFLAYFDTQIGNKREPKSYQEIAHQLNFQAKDILFLSDVEAELDAASAVGFQVIQVLRPGITPSQKHQTVANFNEINVHEINTI
jgi:enolase-phosphatase E1